MADEDAQRRPIGFWRPGDDPAAFAEEIYRAFNQAAGRTVIEPLEERGDSPDGDVLLRVHRQYGSRLTGTHLESLTLGDTGVVYVTDGEARGGPYTHVEDALSAHPGILTITSSEVVTIDTRIATDLELSALIRVDPAAAFSDEVDPVEEADVTWSKFGEVCRPQVVINDISWYVWRWDDRGETDLLIPANFTTRNESTLLARITWWGNDEYHEELCAVGDLRYYRSSLGIDGDPLDEPSRYWRSERTQVEDATKFFQYQLHRLRERSGVATSDVLSDGQISEALTADQIDWDRWELSPGGRSSPN